MILKKGKKKLLYKKKVMKLVSAFKGTYGSDRHSRENPSFLRFGYNPNCLPSKKVPKGIFFVR